MANNNLNNILTVNAIFDASNIQETKKVLANIYIPDAQMELEAFGMKFKRCSCDKRLFVTKDGRYIIKVLHNHIQLTHKGKDKGKILAKPTPHYNYLKKLTAMKVCGEYKGEHTTCWNMGELVIDAWKGEQKPGEGYDIDHINGICDDNRVENLQWLTHEENCQKKKTQLKFTADFLF